jgi:hypothetical protein
MGIGLAVRAGSQQCLHHGVASIRFRSACNGQKMPAEKPRASLSLHCKQLFLKSKDAGFLLPHITNEGGGRTIRRRVVKSDALAAVSGRR